MSGKQPKPEPFEKRHRSGTLWAKGQTIDGVPTGSWEWYREDGSRMRSGSFENGEQTGEWTTYARDGRVVKVTRMRPKKGTSAPSTPSAKATARPKRKPKKKL